MEYPEKLTNAWWLKNKGLLTSLADHTFIDKSGIGNELEELAKAHGQIDWMGLKPSSKAARNPKALKISEEHGKEQVKRIPALVTKAKAVKSSAEKYEKEWSAKKLLKTGSKTMGTISDACDSYVEALGKQARFFEEDMNLANSNLGKLLVSEKGQYVDMLAEPIKRHHSEPHEREKGYGTRGRL